MPRAFETGLHVLPVGGWQGAKTRCCISIAGNPCDRGQQDTETSNFSYAFRASPFCAAQSASQMSAYFCRFSAAISIANRSSVPQERYISTMQSATSEISCNVPLSILHPATIKNAGFEMLLLRLATNFSFQRTSLPWPRSPRRWKLLGDLLTGANYFKRRLYMVLGLPLLQRGPALILLLLSR